jgi:hypothetical protein
MFSVQKSSGEGEGRQPVRGRSTRTRALTGRLWREVGEFLKLADKLVRNGSQSKVVLDLSRRLPGQPRIV